MIGDGRRKINRLGKILRITSHEHTNQTSQKFTNSSLTHLSSSPSLATTNDTSISELMESLHKISHSLQHLVSTTPTSPLTTISPPPNNPSVPRRRTKCFPNTNYCWSHGFDVHNRHTYATCRFPKPGHQQDATPFNTQNGKLYNLHLKDLPPLSSTTSTTLQTS